MDQLADSNGLKLWNDSAKVRMSIQLLDTLNNLALKPFTYIGHTFLGVIRLNGLKIAKRGSGKDDLHLLQPELVNDLG